MVQIVDPYFGPDQGSPMKYFRSCNLESSISNPRLSQNLNHTNIDENFEFNIGIIPIFYEENELEFIDQKQADF